MLGCRKPGWDIDEVCAQLFNKVSTGFHVGKKNSLKTLLTLLTTTIMKKTTLLKSMLLLCALVAGSGSVWAQTYEWVLVTNYSTLSTSDTYVIAGNVKGGSDWYSLKNNEVKGTAQYLPYQQLLTIADGKITSTVTDNETWVIETTGTSGEYYIKSTKGSYYLQNAKNTKSLITAKSGTDNQNKWKIHYEDSYTDTKDNTYTVTGLYNIGASRMCALYKSTSSTPTINFRCYANSNYSNVDGAEVVFFKRVPVSPAVFGAGKTMISFSDASNALDLTTANLPSGLAAYKVTEATNSAVTLTAVNSTIAAGTGVILTGTASTTYNIPVVATGTDISGTNLLVASDGTSNVKDAYVLSGGKFHPVQAAGIIIPAGKAYLPAGSLTAHELDIEFDNGDVTGIKAVEAQKAFEGAFYNLAGQRVAQPTKGLYIVNGKKVIIK